MKMKRAELERKLKRPRANEFLGGEKEQDGEIEIDPTLGEELFQKKEEMDQLMSERTAIHGEMVNYLFLCVALTQAFPEDPRGWDRPRNFYENFKALLRADQESLRLGSWSTSSMNLASWTRMLTNIEPMLALDPAQAQAIVGPADWQIRPEDLPKHLSILAHERATEKNWKSVVSGAKTLAQLFPEIKSQMQILIRESWPEILASVKEVHDIRPMADALLLVPDLRQSLEQNPAFMRKVQELMRQGMDQKRQQVYFPRQIMNYQIIVADRVYTDPEGKLRIIPKAKPVEQGMPLPERSQVE